MKECVFAAKMTGKFFLPLRPFLTGWLLSFAGFGFLALVVDLQFVTSGTGSLEVALRSSLRDWLPWAVITPLLFRLADRFPVGLKQWPTRLAIHLGACLVVLALYHFWTGAIDPTFHAGLGGPTANQSARPAHAPPNREVGQEPPPPPPPRPPHSFENDRPPPPGRNGPPPTERGDRPPFPPPPENGPSPLQQVRSVVAQHKIDLVHIVTFQLPLYLMIMSAAHASHFHRRDRAREASLARARLDVLLTQLQPHFLFNTLNMIAELVHEDANKAEEMITALSEMLRLTLDANATELVPLYKETQFIERYFAIMESRFGDRLRYECDITPEARDALVPPFLLQPMVENAIKHGLEPKPEGGKVTIRADVIKEVLHVSIGDNGVGLSKEASKREGLGLRNTRERLQQLFGNQASVTMKSNHGTEVEVRLPYQLSTK